MSESADFAEERWLAECDRDARSEPVQGSDVPGLQVASRNIALQALVIAVIAPASHAIGCELEGLAVHDFGPLLRLGQGLFRLLLTGYVVCFDGIASREHDKAGQQYAPRAPKPAAQRAIACSSLPEPLSFTRLPRAHCIAESAYDAEQ
jgi:hypothetical protein